MELQHEGLDRYQVDLRGVAEGRAVPDGQQVAADRRRGGDRRRSCRTLCRCGCRVRTVGRC
eukprot:4924919-Alexandrium_andersonii.AAC.1